MSQSSPDHITTSTTAIDSSTEPTESISHLGSVTRRATWPFARDEICNLDSASSPLNVGARDATDNYYRVDDEDEVDYSESNGSDSDNTQTTEHRKIPRLRTCSGLLNNLQYVSIPSFHLRTIHP